jgi:hypothetical protein
MSLGSITGDRYENDPEATPFAGSVEDSVVGNEDEERAQRDAMVRQLHSQSSALDPHVLHNKHSVPGAAPTAAPEQERLRGESLTEAQLLPYRGRPLLDAGGDAIGPISFIYLDETTGIPKWLGVQIGSLMGSRRVVVPVFGSYVFADTISVPYARSVILDAEVATNGAISPEQDANLYLRFGIPISTERSSSGLPAGQSPKRVTASERWLPTPLVRNLRQAGSRAIAATRRARRRGWPWTHTA